MLPLLVLLLLCQCVCLAFVYISHFSFAYVHVSGKSSEINIPKQCHQSNGQLKILQNMTYKSTYAVYLFSMKQQCRMQNFHVCLSPAYKTSTHTYTRREIPRKSVCSFACQYPRHRRRHTDAFVINFAHGNVQHKIYLYFIGTQTTEEKATKQLKKNIQATDTSNKCTQDTAHANCVCVCVVFPLSSSYE